jgi:two-component system, NtrC family, sensor kinase
VKRQEGDTERKLRERIKELTCLYGIARLSGHPDLSLEQVLQGIAELLPPAWQFPEEAVACIHFQEKVYSTAGYRPDHPDRQQAELFINGQSCGQLEVAYSQKMPAADEGPFLTEERNLIDTIARQVCVVIERRLSHEEKLQLRQQLRHADRLATIGQLAAGVAHELNEPLGSILGFSQLILKSGDLPSSSTADIKKIISASMHARDVIRKLMFFARQTSSQRSLIQLNDVICDGLFLFEARCASHDIELLRDLSSDLPKLHADRAQLNQVLINLVVNAIQAMPDGGRLRISTAKRKRHVTFTVEDNGVGMSEKVRQKVFLPFFTTKEVDEGTGLGLSVVHGIIKYHGGRIGLKSRPGVGTSFTVSLPFATETTEVEND